MQPLVEAELAAAPMEPPNPPPPAGPAQNATGGQAADDPVPLLLQHIAASDISDTPLDSFH
eukprot:63553-Pyramimonas_sp.AAC.1